MKASAPEHLVDAGPLIALLNRRDQWHDWAEQTLALVTGQLWTTEIVLAEACYNLGGTSSSVRRLIALVDTGHLHVAPVLQENAARIVNMMEKFERMDLGDASIVILSERYREARIITVDQRDFPIYRRFGREPLPLIMPA